MVTKLNAHNRHCGLERSTQRGWVSDLLHNNILGCRHVVVGKGKAGRRHRIMYLHY